jgi:arylsulfatase A-like enzyme
LHIFDAHSPYGPPEPFDRKYYPKDRDPRAAELSLGVADNCLPNWLDGIRDRDYLYGQYRAEVDYLDHALGRLFDEPRVRAGLVAFTADHGESFGQHGIFWTHAGVYPDTVRVPLILSWPGAPQLAEVREPTESIDIGRTLLDLVGADKVPFPGRDLRWSLAESPERQARFTMDAHYLSAAITVQDWMLILHLRGHKIPGESLSRDLGEVELFNLREDPGCTQNLVIDDLERAKLMRERLIEWLSQADPVGLGVGESDLTGEQRALLTQLGYADTDDSDGGEAIWDPERFDKNFAKSPWSRLFTDPTANAEKFRPRIDASMYKGN